MKSTTAVLLLAIALTLTLQSPAHGQLKYLETDHLRLIYIGGIHSFIAPHAARCFENALRFHRSLWHQDLSEKVTVFLYDTSDQGNGGAKNTPTDLILAALAPFSYAYETMPANERINTIMNHELTHIFAMDLTSSSDRFFRGLFWGKPRPEADQPLSILYEYLVAPRRSAPSWYHEGIAVFLETWMAGGYGRAMGAYDEMVFRTMVLDSARFWDPVSLESEGTKIDLHVGVNSYLYGTRFMSYLGWRYSPEKVMEWVARTSGTSAYFMSQFHRAFALSVDDAWAQWVEWEHTFQEKNLAAIREYPVTPHRDVTQATLGAVSRAFFDRDQQALYVAVDHPGELAYVAAIDVNDGGIRKLRDIKGPSLFYVSSVAYDPGSKTLFYTTDNYAWRDLMALDVSTGKATKLMNDARVGDLAFDPADSSLWGVRHLNGISSIVYIPYPYDDSHPVNILPYGRDVYDLDVSHDGRWLVASMAEVSGRQTLIKMDIEKLRQRDTTYTELYDFGNAIPQNFIFSDDGRYLYGSSYYTGVSNLFRYDLVTDSMEALSNAETGLFRPIPLGGDSLIAFRYSAKGFVPAVVHAPPIEDINPILYLGQEIVDAHPVVKDWNVGSPRQINLDSAIVKEGTYHIFSEWHRMSLYPVIEGYKSATAIGMRLNIGDYMGLQTADVTATYSPDKGVPSDERWHVNGNYSYLDWDASFAYNGTDFYDLFGPTKTSRKGYSAGLSRSMSLIYDDPRRMDLKFRVAGYGGLERLPDYQNIATSYDNFATATASLSYEDMTASLGAVEYEKGYSWQLGVNSTYLLRRYYPQFIAAADYGVPLPIYHSSVWLRTAAGFCDRDRNDPFANFYFGGFGNNWVDSRAVKRYRRWYSFPGKELNELAGTTFTRGMLEWNLPPLRFRRLGFPALYCSWARCSMFATALSTNVDDKAVRAHAFNFGTQVDLDWQLLSQLRMTLSFGYARAFNEKQRGTDEYMVSLKVL